MSNSTPGASPKHPAEEAKTHQPDEQSTIDMQAVKAARRAFHEWKGQGDCAMLGNL